VQGRIEVEDSRSLDEAAPSFADIRIDPVDRSILIIHGIRVEFEDPRLLTPLPTRYSLEENAVDTHLVWDTDEKDSSELPFFVPLACSRYRLSDEDVHPQNSLRGLCLVPNDTSGTYRRCGFVTLKLCRSSYPLEHLLDHFQPRQKFHIV